MIKYEKNDYSLSIEEFSKKIIIKAIQDIINDELSEDTSVNKSINEFVPYKSTDNHDLNNLVSIEEQLSENDLYGHQFEDLLPENKAKNETQISQRTFNKLNLDFTKVPERKESFEIEKKDIVELTYRSNNSIMKDKKSSDYHNSINVSKPELIDTARLFSKNNNNYQSNKEKLSKYINRNSAKVNYNSSYQPGDLNTSTIKNIDLNLSDSRKLNSCKSPLKSSNHYGRFDKVKINNHSNIVQNSVSESGSSFSLSLNLVLNRVNKVITNIEKEETIEKERSEFIKFLTSSIFANALKILVDEN
eukprot:Mrub_06864.p1 GENE.Mrub_06864~~Mrub_06864.p1  ORF type:complete len:313 (+),score=65.56 Mrub_06864:30-941(+)